jgi:signal transduction histidine kinase/ActR/RegA family two-component response regulator
VGPTLAKHTRSTRVRTYAWLGGGTLLTAALLAWVAGEAISTRESERPATPAETIDLVHELVRLERERHKAVIAFAASGEDEWRHRETEIDGAIARAIGELHLRRQEDDDSAQTLAAAGAGLTLGLLAWATAWRLSRARARDLAAMAGIESRREMVRAKSEFLARVSHELRTPMSAILGYTEVLREHEALGSTLTCRLETIETIHRNGEHLLALINDVLDMSKLEAGAMRVERMPVRLQDALEDVGEMFERSVREKRISLEFVGVGPVPEAVRTDPVRLRQILVNLVGNAVKFTERGSVVVEVRLVDDGGAEPLLELAVCDTGIGMTDEQLGRLFRPFVQAEDSTARRFGGTGLGLAISKQLAEFLGGDLSATSVAGAGSRFVARIAAGTRAGLQLGPLAGWRVAETPPAQGVRGAPTPGVRIAGAVLLAEDGEDSRRLIESHLRAAGAEVVSVADGAAAVANVRERERSGRPFALVLMDIHMLGLDGVAALHAIRAEGFDVPIVALTAGSAEAERDRCLEAGFTAFAGKPIARAALLKLCAEHARQVSGLRSAA